METDGICQASFPGLPCFHSLVCVQYNTRKQKSVNANRRTETGRPGNEARICRAIYRGSLLINKADMPTKLYNKTHALAHLIPSCGD